MTTAFGECFMVCLGYLLDLMTIIYCYLNDPIGWSGSACQLCLALVMHGFQVVAGWVMDDFFRSCGCTEVTVVCPGSRAQDSRLRFWHVREQLGVVCGFTSRFYSCGKEYTGNNHLPWRWWATCPCVHGGGLTHGEERSCNLVTQPSICRQSSQGCFREETAVETNTSSVSPIQSDYTRKHWKLVIVSLC